MNSIFSYFLSILLGITLSMNLHGQIMNSNLKEYYQFTNKAELAIIDSNYTHAMHYYKQAFKTGYQFPVDLFHMMNVSCEIKDYDNAKWSINKLATFNPNKDWIVAHLIRNKLCDSIEIKVLFGDYDNYVSSLDTAMQNDNRAIWDLMYVIDQGCRKTDTTYIDRCDRWIDKELIDFINKKGFPTYEKIGLKLYFVNIGYRDTEIDMLLTHRRSMKDNELMKLAYKATMIGDYDIRAFITSWDFGSNDYWIVIPENYSAKELEEVNKKRAEIGLCDIEDYLKKIEYSQRKENLKSQKYNFFTFFTIGISYMKL